MSLLIDGYNLLHLSGVLGRGRGPGYLERGRLALLNVLAESLDEEQRRRTTIVFDAKDAPRELVAATKHQGMFVRYAVEHADADELIEQLIDADSAPRQLTVVSSDRRIQQAARRRGAKAAASVAWWEELLRARARQRASHADRASEERLADPFPPGYFDDLDDGE